jgi:sugar phosphate isomerase/epimerase
MYDYMLENSPIIFEVDAFWAEVGGKNAAEVIRANPDRIALVHIKDGSAREPGKDVVFGEGIMDWDDIIAAADDAGCEYYVVELDNPNPDDPAGDVAKAYTNAMAKMS